MIPTTLEMAIVQRVWDEMYPDTPWETVSPGDRATFAREVRLARAVARLEMRRAGLQVGQ